MKNIAFAVFVKTPDLSPLNLSLDDFFDENTCKEFYIQSIKTLEETILSLSQKNQEVEVTPYWVVAEKEGLQNQLWQNFNKTLKPESENLGEQLASLEDSLLEIHDGLILMPSVLPQMSSSELLNIIEKVAQGDTVLSANHNGEYGLYGSTLNLSFQEWKSLSHNDEQSFHNFRCLLEQRTTVHELDENFKIFSPEGLKKLAIHFSKAQTLNHQLLPEQVKLGNWLRSHLS